MLVLFLASTLFVSLITDCAFAFTSDFACASKFELLMLYPDTDGIAAVLAVSFVYAFTETVPTTNIVATDNARTFGNTGLFILISLLFHFFNNVYFKLHRSLPVI